MPKKNPDKQIVKCKVCGLKRVKQRGNTSAKGRSFFVDEMGRMWNGMVCPTCNVKRIDPYCKRYRRYTKIDPEEFLKRVQEKYAEIVGKMEKAKLKKILKDMEDEKEKEMDKNIVKDFYEQNGQDISSVTE